MPLKLQSAQIDSTILHGDRRDIKQNHGAEKLQQPQYEDFCMAVKVKCIAAVDDPREAAIVICLDHSATWPFEKLACPLPKLNVNNCKLFELCGTPPARIRRAK